MADGEEGAEVFAAAVTKDQAAICFRDAAAWCRESGSRVAHRFQRGKPGLQPGDTRSGSFFRPVSAEGRSLDGKRPHGVLVDELHEHDSPIVLEKLCAGFKGRRQPLMLMITNSGFDRTSVCFSVPRIRWQSGNRQAGRAGIRRPILRLRVRAG